ncbi:hypothetical protein F7725_028055 [Dissostichus mawsoni]|uniref:Uncharacterized protein n=1 Tax=Dissostichus mawsoni TaxID=36200 RepID=A0A7J5XFW9_DISMA|nr:hypothetical protein F7725_028055 [Dissostichus mawsoni]
MQGKKSLRKAGRDSNIDKTTLQRFIKKKEKGESPEDERSDPGNTDLNVGDFVLVNFATKHRSLRYVGMVEKVEDDEILTQFLRRIQGNKKQWERPTFAIKENDVAHVPKGDVVKKLPQPNRPGGTTRREQLFTFPWLECRVGLVIEYEADVLIQVGLACVLSPRLF